MLLDLREVFIECERDPTNSSHMSKDDNPTKIVANRGLMIQLERYENTLYTAARTIISVLVRVCGFNNCVMDTFNITDLKNGIDIRGVTLGDLTRISITKGTNIVVHGSQSTSYTGVISGKCKRMNPTCEWEIESTTAGLH